MCRRILIFRGLRGPRNNWLPHESICRGPGSVRLNAAKRPLCRPTLGFLQFCWASADSPTFLSRPASGVPRHVRPCQCYTEGKQTLAMKALSVFVFLCVSTGWSQSAVTPLDARSEEHTPE